MGQGFDSCKCRSASQAVLWSGNSFELITVSIFIMTFRNLSKYSRQGDGFMACEGVLKYKILRCPALKEVYASMSKYEGMLVIVEVFFELRKNSSSY